MFILQCRSLSWATFVFFLALIIPEISIGAKSAPPASVTSLVQPGKIYLRNSYDEEAGYLVGRFFADDAPLQYLSESMAFPTRCSGFIKYHSVTMSGRDEEVVSHGNAIRRLQFQFVSKLVAKIDMEGFSQCCSAHPDQCPSRYIDSVIKGEVFERTDAQGEAQGSRTIREMGAAQYFGFTIALTPKSSPRTTEAVIASVVDQLLPFLGSKTKPLPIAIEPVNADDARARWVSMQMASALSQNGERFFLKKVPANWAPNHENDLPPGVQLFLSFQILEKGPEIELVWSALFSKPQQDVRFIQLKPVSLPLSLLPQYIQKPSISQQQPPPVTQPPQQTQLLPSAPKIVSSRYLVVPLYGFAVEAKSAETFTIIDIARGSPAARADLEAGDILKEVNDQYIESIHQIKTIITNHPFNKPIRLKVARPMFGRLSILTIELISDNL
ncbi:MAG: PDZ domain-containing protein [Myxococcales bacterium]|jgi:hypothetical protein|nr:PDZ domain-containing protein [Myxococcales bacterium]